MPDAAADDAILPAGFEDLEPLVQDWALDTQNQREAQRLRSTAAELKAVYDALMPHIGRIMTEVDRFPIGGLPPAQARLFSLAFSLAEIAPNVELYKGDPLITHDFDERRFRSSHGAHVNWTGLQVR